MIEIRKHDARSKFTQSQIEQALITLLKERKSVKNISISLLCKTASISRGTFYNQYSDIYDVYTSMEDKSFEEIINKLENTKVYSLKKGFFKDIMYLILTNKDWFAILLSDRESTSFARRITDYVKDKFIKEYSALNPRLSKSELERVFTFAATGSIALISEWVINDTNESPEDMANFINNINMTIIDKIPSGITKTN